MILRRNILDLIGKHRGKYHSCILTSYSFDFSFFEERVLPVLRVANIKNVNVFADGRMLELAQSMTTGKEFLHNKTYNFQPVYCTGAFHPKIMLLTGKKHGLLVIGSGNITSAGLSSNDEIWGAFQLDNTENENAPLFAQAWAYLQQFINESHGFLKQKFEWIKTYSPWLQDLPKPDQSTTLESISQSVEFVSNKDGESTFMNLVQKVSKYNIESITIVSPFYDQNGSTLDELYQHYQPIALNCVVDTTHGTLPSDLMITSESKIKFYDWKDCKQDYNIDFDRLHAKFIHFAFNDGNEYLLLGSSNATKAGMGTSFKSAINHEAGIIISRNSNVSWLEQLGIKLNKPIAISSAKQNNNLIPVVKGKNHLTKLLYAELMGNEITIFTSSAFDIKKTSIVIITRDLFESEILSIQSESNKIWAKCNLPDEVFKILLVDEGGKSISNYCLVHRLESLMKCNPDPEQSKLSEYLQSEYPDGEGVSEILAFNDYNWADEGEVQQTHSASGSLQNKNAILTVFTPAEKLSPDEFNKVSNDILLKQSGELNNNSVRIAEFLAIVSSRFAKKINEFGESEEQRLLIDDDQQGQGGEVDSSQKKKSMGRKERDAIAKFLKRLNFEYELRLYDFYRSKSLTQAPQVALTIRAFSSMLIALQLVQIYHGKKYTLEQNDEHTSTLVQENFIDEGDICSGPETLKGLMIDIFGKFLLLSTAGVRHYEFDILNNKLYLNRKDTFVKAIFSILNLEWKASELRYRDTLLLNSLYFINPDDCSNPSFSTELNKLIMHMRNKAKFVSHNFSQNFHFFSDKLLPEYTVWLLKFNNKVSKESLIEETTTLKNDSIIFNRRIGFSIIYRVVNSSTYPRLDLVRAGYEWDDELKLCIFKDISYGQKSVVYKRSDSQ